MRREKEKILYKGEHSEEELIQIALEQINSAQPQQIRVLEGMGSAIHTRGQIRKIKKLPPEDRATEIQTIITDMRSADIIYVENPSPPKQQY